MCNASKVETRSIGSRHRSRPTLRLVGGSKQTSQRRYTPLQNAPIGDNISALIGRTHAQVTAFAGSADLRHGNSAAGGMGANRADLIPDSTSKSLRVQLPFVPLTFNKELLSPKPRDPPPLCNSGCSVLVWPDDIPPYRSLMRKSRQGSEATPSPFLRVQWGAGGVVMPDERHCKLLIKGVEFEGSIMLRQLYTRHAQPETSPPHMHMQLYTLTLAQP